MISSVPNATGLAVQRLDKWLWAARWFKTRALAADQCDLGRVLVNGAAAKPAKEVRAGDMLVIQQEHGQFEVEVLALGLQRLSAALAQTRYRETERSSMERARLSELHRLSPEPQAVRQGRPSKLERRQLLRLRDTLPD